MRPGHSFLEMMVAVFLLALGATAFSALMPVAARSAQMVGNYQQASGIIQHKIDELRSVGYGRLTYSELQAAGIIDASPASLPYSFAGVDGLNTIYTSASGSINVTTFSTNIKQVTVTLTWNGSSIKQNNGSLTAVVLIAQP